jgi:DNA-binding LytR/AlgR family response regulator
MNILIIEDEHYAAQRLEKMLKEMIPDLHVAAKIESIEQSVLWLKEHEAPDLIFLDIQLSDGSCFNIFDQCDVPSPIIFVTAYDEYALQAFKLNSIDYLLKPIDKEELKRSLDKFRRVTSALKPSFVYPDVKKIIRSIRTMPPIYRARFLVKTGQTFSTIFMNDIAYFFADHKISYLATHEGKKHILDQTLEELEDQLDPKVFFRLNRQFIASVNSIAKLHNFFNRKLKVELMPPANIEVIVSREKAAEFKKWLNQ